MNLLRKLVKRLLSLLVIVFIIPSAFGQTPTPPLDPSIFPSPNVNSPAELIIELSQGLSWDPARFSALTPSSYPTSVGFGYRFTDWTFTSNFIFPASAYGIGISHAWQHSEFGKIGLFFATLGLLNGIPETGFISPGVSYDWQDTDWGFKFAFPLSIPYDGVYHWSNFMLFELTGRKQLKSSRLVFGLQQAHIRLDWYFPIHANFEGRTGAYSNAYGFYQGWYQEMPLGVSLGISWRPTKDKG